MARTPEGSVKDYLVNRIEALDGEVRFMKYIGRRNCPDVRVRFRGGWCTHPVNGLTIIPNCWVETKGKDGKLSAGQEREIKRMREMGEVVLVLLSKADIDREFPL